MLAARLRAKPRFGRRVLVALVPEPMADAARREAIHSGFDYALVDTCGARDLAAAILRLLREPEHGLLSNVLVPRLVSREIVERLNHIDAVSDRRGENGFVSCSSRT